jgi:hypothetical protein
LGNQRAVKIRRRALHKGLLEIHVGDRVRMRKPHPCGGYEWEVTRIGADIGIRCLTCGRRVMLPRSKFEKRVKTIVDTAGGEAAG